MPYSFAPLPPRMTFLPVDRRNLPIPYVVLIDSNNVPRFQINDTRKVEEVLQKGLCSICGQPMPENDQWLVGGPKSAFHPRGLYIDTPTHYQCLHYALQMCPYLSGKQTNRVDPQKLVSDPALEGVAGLVDPTLDPDRVPFFVAIQIIGFRLIYPAPERRYLVPDRPYLAMEFWHQGQQISQQEALRKLL